VSTTEAAFLGLLFAGVASLVAAVVITRVHWRSDIPLYGRRTSALRVLRHPEEFVQDAPLGVIHVLNLTGVLLLAGAIALVIYEILRTME